MKPEFYLPDAQAVLDIQRELIQEHGGAEGVRDHGALDAAIARSEHISAYSDGHASIFEMAAAICAAIIRRHPFVDGNKRAAFSTLGATLIMNDLYLDVTEREADRIIKALAASEIDEASFVEWVTTNSFEAPE